MPWEFLCLVLCSIRVGLSRPTINQRGHTSWLDALDSRAIEPSFRTTVATRHPVAEKSFTHILIRFATAPRWCLRGGGGGGGRTSERKKRVDPGSPCRPERPRSWLSMRRDSWRSVPTTCSPPSARTSSRSTLVTTENSAAIASNAARNCRPR